MARIKYTARKSTCHAATSKPSSDPAETPEELRIKTHLKDILGSLDDDIEYIMETLEKLSDDNKLILLDLKGCLKQEQYQENALKGKLFVIPANIFYLLCIFLCLIIIMTYIKA